MTMSGGDRLFGTDGIRGVAGEYPLDTRTTIAIGRALTAELRRELGSSPRIVVGRDTRQSGPEIERALAAGAFSEGAHVESAGIITTPGVAYITRAAGFDAGVVISASHNPYHDNGIKVFSPSGKKLPDEAERLIESDVARLLALPAGQATDLPVDFGRAENRFAEQYIEYLTREVGRGLDLGSLRLGIDCANGAASSIAPTVFKQLGARVEVICAEPDGLNINEGCGSLHQQKLQALVRDQGLDVGIAFDGDADRALLVDSKGSMVDGDQELLILADYMRSHGRLNGHIVVATVMSNLGLELALRDRGIQLIRTQVGDRFVLEEMIARDARLGGEQSGHIILPDISLSGDGILTAIEVLRAVVESGRTVGDLASQVTRYPQVLVNIKVKSKPPLESLPEVAAEIQRLEELMQGRGRLLVRYSGTENLARVMIEGEDMATITAQADFLAELIKRALDS